MRDPNKKEYPQVNPTDVCRRAFELMGAKQYADVEKLITSNMAKTEDDAAIGLYHSVLGVLFKLQGEFKTAWKHYERAEKLLPDDPAMKIISARLLIEQFAQYDQAIKKAKKVLKLIPDNPVFRHQAFTTMGLGSLKKGEKRAAIEALEASMEGGFRGFITAKNIDFTLVEGLLRRGWGEDRCRLFLERALGFAKTSNEEKFILLFEEMLAAYDEEYSSGIQK